MNEPNVFLTFIKALANVGFKLWEQASNFQVIWTKYIGDLVVDTVENILSEFADFGVLGDGAVALIQLYLSVMGLGRFTDGVFVSAPITLFEFFFSVGLAFVVCFAIVHWLFRLIDDFIPL